MSATEWLHLPKPSLFLLPAVKQIQELTKVDGRDHVSTADNTPDAGTRGVSATALYEKSWLRGADFLRLFELPFLPCTDVVTRIKSEKIATGTELIEETFEATIPTAHVTTMAVALIVKCTAFTRNCYILLRCVPDTFLPEFGCIRTKSGFKDEVLEAE